MNGTSASLSRTKDDHDLIRRVIATSVIVLLWWSALALTQNSNQKTNLTEPVSLHTTHLLGFENALNNASGTLSIQEDALQFQKDGKPAVQVKIAALQNMFVGEEDKQVGGLPMTLGKTAAPFGGGRAVSLFAHKKYDVLALEYVDGNGGLHGAIFQVEKGQGEALRNELVARGAHIDHSDQESAKPATSGGAQ